MFQYWTCDIDIKVIVLDDSVQLLQHVLNALHLPEGSGEHDVGLHWSAPLNLLLQHSLDAGALHNGVDFFLNAKIGKDISGNGSHVFTEGHQALAVLECSLHLTDCGLIPEGDVGVGPGYDEQEGHSHLRSRHLDDFSRTSCINSHDERNPEVEEEAK